MSKTRTGGLAALLTGAWLVAMGTAQAHEEQTTVKWGPIELPAATEESAGAVHNHITGAPGLGGQLIGIFMGQDDFEVQKPCGDCYIVGIEPNMVLEDGTVANHDNGTMLHHVVNVNFSRRDITCRPKLFGDAIQLVGALAGGNERIFAAGNERTSGKLPEGYGYYVNEDDDWGLIYHLMNMSSEPKTVYLQYTFTWIDAADHGEEVKPVRPIWADIDQCGDSEADVPAGYSDIHWTWRADRTHEVVGMGGHIHNYGISTAWHNETQDETVCASVAGYPPESDKTPIGPGTGVDDAHPMSYNTVTSDPLGLEHFQGNISDMTKCVFQPNEMPQVHRGDKMRLHTQISRPNATDHDMGIMVGFIDEGFCLTDYWCF